MANAYKFNGAYGGHYIITTAGSAGPAFFEQISTTDYARFGKFLTAIRNELATSREIPASFLTLLSSNGAQSGLTLKDALDTLVNFFIEGKLLVFVDIPKTLPHELSLAEQLVGSASAYNNDPEDSNKGATDDNNAAGPAQNSAETNKSLSEHATCGDPVSMVTGEEILSLQDFSLNGLLPLIWTRLYRSSKIKKNSGLGFGWRHAFNVELIARFDAPPKVGPKQAGKHWFELIDEEGIHYPFNLVNRGQVSIQTSSGLTLLNDGPNRQVLIKPDESHWVFTKTNDVWQLTSINNELGHELNLHYDSQQRLYRIAVTGQRGAVFYYNSDNNIVRIAPYLTNSNGQMMAESQLLASYQYDDNQSLIAAINSEGNTEQYSYLDNALLTKRTRASGFNHYFEWLGEDELAKCSRQWGDDGAYDYHFEYEGNKSSSTDSLGNTEHYYHDAQELLTCHINANGHKTEHEYDTHKRKIKTIDGLGGVTLYHYNTMGQLASVTAADGNIERYIYNAFGKRIAIIDAIGQQFTRKFNASGLLLSDTLPDGRVATYQYNEAGLLVSTIDVAGVKSHFEWSESGELLAEKVGNTLTRYSYDKLGRLNALIDAQGLVTEYQRNEQGLMTQKINYQRKPTAQHQPSNADESTITRYSYDKAGRLTLITNPNGGTTHYGYGGLAQPTKKTFEDGSWLNYQYDKERNLIGIERSDEATYKIEYSPTEKPTKLIGFDGRVQTYQYDNNDKLIAVNDADERIIQLKRDSLGNIVDQHSFTTHNNKQLNFNSHNFYQYDAIGRITLAHNSDRVVQHQYHLNGQVSQSKQGDWALNYQFNNKGQRSQLTLPDGKQLDYQYNELGQLSHLKVQSESQETALLALQYSAVGQITQQALGNGITLEQHYDVKSRLTRQSWVGKQGYQQQRDYQYDKQNQLIKCNESTESDESAQCNEKEQHTQSGLETNTEQKTAQQTVRTFTYNQLSQLVGSVCESSQPSKQQTEHYKWDAFGNPEVDHTVAKAERDTRIENDRLLCSAGVDYRYDKSGNQISSIASGLIQKRSFDGLNQLRQINSNDKLSQYQYDALGRRSAKITETGRTDFIWDGNQLIGEVSNGQYTWYIYLPESFLPVALIKDNQVYYYHLDQLGTPVCLTDKHEQIVWQNQGDFFGDEAKTEQDSLESEKKNNIENPLRFQGQYFDSESGLHYNRFRYYCPKQGRFIHQDPIGLLGGINHYQYAPNPVNWVDPFGLCPKENISTYSNMGTIEPIVGRPTIGLLKYTVNALTMGIVYGDISSINALNAGPQDMEDIAAYIDSAGAERYAMMIVPTNMASKAAKFGSSITKNYKKTFFEANPLTQGNVVVHHAVEQQVQRRYPGLVSNSEMHSLDNLRGIPKAINSDVHLSQIRKEWNRFYKLNPNPTKQQLLDKATEVDNILGNLFNPKIR